METLPPRIDDANLLALTGDILCAAPTPDANLALRQRLYTGAMPWVALTSFAATQQILPPLIWALRSRGLLMPTPRALQPEQRRNFINTRLDDAYEAHNARRDDLRDQLYNCVAALNRAGISPVILKGARYLLAADDQWGAARPMRDIDLLIRPASAAAALAALRGIGYVADAATGLQHQHLPELRLAGRHGVVELHTDALAPAGARFMPTDLVWQQAVAVAVGDAPAHALMLPDSWQALHALLHHQASDDGYHQHSLALKPLWEFTCLTHSLDQAAWQALIGVMQRLNGLDLLASWCLQAERIYHLPPPALLPVSAAARAQVARCFDEAGQPDLSRRRRFILRQLQRGFSAEMLAARYAQAPDDIGLRLRAKHAWFLLRRYRGQLGARLLGGP